MSCVLSVLPMQESTTHEMFQIISTRYKVVRAAENDGFSWEGQTESDYNNSKIGNSGCFLPTLVKCFPFRQLAKLICTAWTLDNPLFWCHLSQVNAVSTETCKKPNLLNFWNMMFYNQLSIVIYLYECNRGLETECSTWNVDLRFLSIWASFAGKESKEQTPPPTESDGGFYGKNSGRWLEDYSTILALKLRKTMKKLRTQG